MPRPLMADTIKVKFVCLPVYACKSGRAELQAFQQGVFLVPLNTGDYEYNERTWMMPGCIINAGESGRLWQDAAE